MARFTSGLFWGALFGATISLLNAPQSGKVTRQNIKNFIDQTTADVDDLRYKVDNLRVAVEKLTNEGVESAQVATQEIQQSLKSFQSETAPRVRRIQETIETLQQNIEEQIN